MPFQFIKIAKIAILVQMCCLMPPGKYFTEALFLSRAEATGTYLHW